VGDNSPAIFERMNPMAEYTNAAAQTVAAGQAVTFSQTAVPGTACIQHREGSGIATLRGLTNQCRARFLVHFGGNIAIPTGGTVEAISVAISLAGEALAASTAIVTPAATENYFNVAVETYVDVPRGCCLNVAVENTGTQAILVQNANLIITREA